MNPKISIIIPVYNVESYLQKCLNSVLNQTFSYIEILCIDDASTDQSLKILKENGKKDKRIKIFEQKTNNGQGAARNLGVINSKGQYLLFVDSDDWIDLKTCEIFYKIAKKHNLDILQGLYTQIDEQHNHIKNKYHYLNNKIYGNIFSGMELWKNVPLLSTSNCDKLWRRDFFIKNNLANTEKGFYEDTLTSIRGTLLAQKILIMHYPFYNYRFNANSTTKEKYNLGKNNKKFNSFIFMMKGFVELMQECNLWKFRCAVEMFISQIVYLNQVSSGLSLKLKLECLKTEIMLKALCCKKTDLKIFFQLRLKILLMLFLPIPLTAGLMRLKKYIAK